jgi:triosephosphate isomerase
LKITAATKSGLVPIYCVGETAEQRAEGKTAEVIKQQITKGLEGLSQLSASRVVVAYEPVWAVGSDQLPTSNDILEVKILLKRTLAEMFGMETVEKIKLLYGGSVKSSLIQQVCTDPGMDGVLVGRESLIPNELIKMAEIIEKS